MTTSGSSAVYVKLNADGTATLGGGEVELGIKGRGRPAAGW
jgi:hypothetical protein